MVDLQKVVSDAQTRATAQQFLDISDQCHEIQKTLNEVLFMAGAGQANPDYVRENIKSFQRLSGDCYQVGGLVMDLKGLIDEALSSAANLEIYRGISRL